VGDASRLRQVIVNLVGNAIKFTHAGEVVLTVATEATSRQEVALQFTVADTGIGIPQDKLPLIFDAFEQADSSRTRRFGGTGLGLAISSHLVALMGGRIWVESEMGRGSVFHFTARFGRLVHELRAPRQVATPLPDGMRVLVVDDNATNCRILEEMLRNRGMQPHVASSANEALQMLRDARARRCPYQLVLSDVHMPGADGFALVEGIQRDSDLGGTVIMMLTSGDQPGDIDRCEELGVSSYLLKPVKQSELLDAIAAAVGAATPHDEVAEEAVGPELPATRPLRVLLAEDSEMNQRLAVAMLEKEGHRVTIAGDGEEAVAAWRSGNFDLVLMDVQMPVMDGFEAARAIRAQEAGGERRTPIIAMTAHALKGDRERCLEAGMDDYVSKPVNRTTLVAVVNRLVSGAPEPATAEPETTTDPVSSSDVQEVSRPDGTADCSVDWEAALDAVDGDRELLVSLAALAIEEFPRLMDGIREAVSAGDAPALRFAAHKLKGQLRFFVRTQIADHAYALERQGHDGDLDGVPDSLATLEDAMTRLLADLSAFVAREQAGGNPPRSDE
jgi:CheY-like chemotaxis protein